MIARRAWPHRQLIPHVTWKGAASGKRGGLAAAVAASELLVLTSGVSRCGGAEVSDHLHRCRDDVVCTCLFASVYVCLSVGQSVCLSVRPFVCPSACACVCVTLYIFPSVCFVDCQRPFLQRSKWVLLPKHSLQQRLHDNFPVFLSACLSVPLCWQWIA